MDILKTIWNWLLEQPKFVQLALIIICLMLSGTALVTLVTRPTGKSFGKHFFSKWMGLAEILQLIIMTTLLTILYLFFVPFFVFLFMRKDDLLGKDLSDDSFWHDSAEIDYSLRRTYKLY